MESKSSTDQWRRRRIFFRAAAVAFNVQFCFFEANTEILVFIQCQTKSQAVAKIADHILPHSST